MLVEVDPGCVDVDELEVLVELELVLVLVLDVLFLKGVLVEVGPAGPPAPPGFRSGAGVIVGGVCELEEVLVDVDVDAEVMVLFLPAPKVGVRIAEPEELVIFDTFGGVIPEPPAVAPGPSGFLSFHSALASGLSFSQSLSMSSST